jgi:hypothetical protein
LRSFFLLQEHDSQTTSLSTYSNHPAEYFNRLLGSVSVAIASLFISVAR